MRLPDLALALGRAGILGAVCLLASLLCWRAACLEACPWLQGGSQDPFDQPVLRAAKRASRVPAAAKIAAVQCSVEGTLCRSGEKCVGLAKRLKARWPLAAQTVATWDLPEARRLAAALRAHVDGTTGLVILSCGATRFGGRGVLLAACWLDELQQAFGGPPQVRTLAVHAMQGVQKRSAEIRLNIFRHAEKPFISVYFR